MKNKRKNSYFRRDKRETIREDKNMTYSTFSPIF